jgi:hypothetical protein
VPRRRSKQIESELDELYGLPAEEFTAARNEAARRLRAAGDAAGAERLAKAKKPTLAAWAVNQLGRRHADQIAALLRAGKRLRDAGGDRAKLRKATEQEREAVQRLVSSADRLLERPSGPLLDRVRETLHAASVDDEAGRAVQEGRLTKELQAVGFGGLMGGGRVSARPASPRAASQARDAERELTRARKGFDEAQSALDDAVARVKEAKDRLNRDRATERRADKQLAAARSRRDKAVHDARRAGLTDRQLADTAGLSAKEIRAILGQSRTSTPKA